MLIRFTEHNPYGTPISLSVHSPFYALASSQDDPLAIPDSPERGAWSRSRDLYRAHPRLNVERAKSESPELSASVHKYPSSQPPEDPAASASITLNSSQPTSSQTAGVRNNDESPNNIPSAENAPRGRYSSHFDGSLTKPLSPRGYYVLRSVQEERPSQIDPIETDDSLSQEQIATHCLNQRHLRRTLPTTSTISDHVRNFPLASCPDDQTNGQSRDKETSQVTRDREIYGESAQSFAPPSVQSLTIPNKSTQPPLAEAMIETQASLHTPAAHHKASPHATGQRPLLGREHAQNSQDLSLSPCPPISDKTNISEGGPDVLKKQLGERHSEISSSVVPTGAALCSPTPAVKALLQEQKLNTKEGAANPFQDIDASADNPELDDRGPHENNVAESSLKALQKQEQVVGRIAQNDHGIEVGAASSVRDDVIAEQQRSDKAVREVHPANTTRISKLCDAETPEQRINSASHTGTEATTAQKQARQAIVASPKQRSRTGGKAVKSIDIASKRPQASRDAQGKSCRKSTAVGHDNAEDPTVTTNYKTEDVKITTIPSAEREREAEEKSKRQADAVAHFLNREGLKPQTPSTTKSLGRKIKNTNRMSAPIAADPSVQRLRNATSTDNERLSSPSIRSGSVGQQRSMTPLFPSSTLKRPTKSALRTSGSTTPRSVSFVDDPVGPLGPLKSASSKSAKPRIENAKDAVNSVTDFRTSSKTYSSKSQTPQSRTSEKSAPVKKEIHASDSRPRTRKSATPSSAAHAKPKTQTKLNVTRDVKLKGRADGPTNSPKPVEEKETVLSSDCEMSASTFYSDEEDVPRSAKAGPSKKRKLTYSMKSEPAQFDFEIKKPLPSSTFVPTHEAECFSSSGKIKLSRGDGILQGPKVAVPKLQSKPSLPSSRSKKTDGGSVSKDISRETSTSRSPAQYMSKAGSATSASASGSGSPAASRSGDELSSESGSQYETGSEAEDESESVSEVAESDVSTKSSANASLANQPGTELRKRGDLPSETSKKSSNSQSQAAASQSKDLTKSDDEDDGKIAHEMDQQLQREYRQSIQSSRTKPMEKAATKQGAAKSSPTLANKPNKSRFPSLTGLRGRAFEPENDSSGTAAKTLKTSLNSTSVLNSTKQGEPWYGDETETSSSDSEEESSSSDDQTNQNGGSSQTSVPQIPKPQSGPMKGIRSLLKCMFSYEALPAFAQF